MPTVLRIERYRIVIYPNDHRPCHVHALDREINATFFLFCPDGPAAERSNGGLAARTLKMIREALNERLDMLCNVWRKHHGNY